MQPPGVMKICISVVFILVSCLSLLAYFELPKLLLDIILHQSGLKKGSLAADLFANIPFEVRQKVYFFNITNIDEFYAGAKPRFVELGPYVFRVGLHKDMSWFGYDEDFLTYREKRTFTFLPELSKGNINDSVYTVDPVFKVLQEIVDDLPEIVQKVVRPLLNQRKILFKHTVDELLYYGYKDELALIAHLIQPDLPVIDGRIGYLRALNNSDDGNMTVYAGITRDSRFARNQIIQWNRKVKLPYYKDGCNDIWGTNFELYQTFTEETAPMLIGGFLPLLCRPWKLHLNGTRSHYKLNVMRYSTQNDIFSSEPHAGIDQCEQPHGWPQGLFDISKCWHRFPALVSLPHFLRADSKLLEDVEGLNPDINKHDLVFDLYPLLGIPVHAAFRIQANVRIYRKLDITLPNNNPIVYPVFWQEIGLAESDESSLASIIFYAIELPQKALTGLALVICIASLAILPLYWGLFTCLNKKPKDEIEQAIVTAAENISAGSNSDSDLVGSTSPVSEVNSITSRTGHRTTTTDPSVVV